jgi:signal transduction histidine kinase
VTLRSGVSQVTRAQNLYLIPLERELEERLGWFIGMRWFAAAGILAGTALATILRLEGLATAPLLLIGIAVGVYNLGFHLLRSGVESQQIPVRHLIYVQIALDWLALILIVHFSGGIHSPVALAFTFHLIIAAILLTRGACYLLAGCASLLLGALTLLAEAGFVDPPPIHLIYLGSTEAGLSGAHIWIALTGFFLVTAHLATSITTRLRTKEWALFDSERAVHRAYLEMEALYELGQVVNSTLDLKEVLSLIAEHAARLLKMKSCFIRLFDKSGQMLYVGGAYGLSQAYINKGPVAVVKSLIDREALKGGVVKVPEVADDPRFQYRLEAQREGLRSMLSVPLQAKSRILGVIRVYSGQPHHFSDQEESLLRNLANLGAVAIENARAYSELQALTEEKIWFAHMTHHQLRSPLAAVQGVLDALPYAGPLSEKQNDLIRRARRRIEDSFGMIRDFLDLAASRRPSAAVPPEPIDLTEALRGTIETVQETARTKGVELLVDWEGAPLNVRAESADLERIFGNLLDNAVKYTPPGGRVTLSANRQDGGIRTEIADTGIGIAPEDQGRIFEDFYRTSAAKASGETGSGLGLSIVKILVDRLGGSIELDSTPGKGSSFRVSLPIA